MTKPRLFYWLELLPPHIGGIETFSAALLPKLAQRGYEVHALTSDDNGTLPAIEETDGYTIHRLPVREAVGSTDPGLLLETISKVKRLKQAIGPATVHLNFSGPIAFFHMKTAIVNPGPLLTTFHGTLDGIRTDPGTLVADIFARSDRLIANSEAVLTDLRNAAPDAAGKMSVVYCGVEVSPETAAMDIHAPPHLLFVGRLVPDKGADLALESFARVRERFPDARFTIAGDGGERSALEEQVATLGIADAVRFPGWVMSQDVAALMREATMIIMPSRWREPFGLVAVEAALQCRPVLGTAAGGLMEAIEDGVSGRLVPREDVDALTDAAIAMLSDRAGLAAMGERARARAIRMFSLDAAADSLDTLYRGLDSRS